MYGSVVNRLMENQVEVPTIEVGMKVTEYLYTDRDVYEVIEVKNQKDVVIRMMNAIHKAAYSNDVDLVSNEHGIIKNVVYRYNHWYEKYVCDNGKVIYTKIKLVFGRSDYYYDFEF